MSLLDCMNHAVLTFIPHQCSNSVRHQLPTIMHQKLVDVTFVDVMVSNMIRCESHQEKHLET